MLLGFGDGNQPQVGRRGQLELLRQTPHPLHTAPHTSTTALTPVTLPPSISYDSIALPTTSYMVHGRLLAFQSLALELLVEAEHGPLVGGRVNVS